MKNGKLYIKNKKIAFTVARDSDHTIVAIKNSILAIFVRNI